MNRWMRVDPPAPAAYESAGRAARRPVGGPPARRLTTLEAFAYAALVVSAVAFAYAVGRRQADEPFVPAAGVQTIEAVQQSPPITFDELQVDTGQMR